MPSEKSKTCIVPSCKASNSDHPDRIFFTVPETKKKQWFEIVGCDVDSIEPNKRQFCCENHFSVCTSLSLLSLVIQNVNIALHLLD